jgi:hypothetical protein
VLRPGGRLALAVWDAVDANPWAALPAAVLRDEGLAPAPGSQGPGPFTLGSEQLVRELLEQAGFAEIEIRAVEMLREHPSFEDFWELTLDLSRAFHDAVMSQPAETIEQLRGELQARLEPYTKPDGVLALPGRTLVARAEA